MGEKGDGDREYWRAVLLAGGATQVPRWTQSHVTGVARHSVPVPHELDSALQRFAAELSMPVSALLLAAHAKVLTGLSGEREVVTGYLTPQGPLPSLLTTEPATWRALAATTHRVESELLSHVDHPVEELRRELGGAATRAEVAFDPTGAAGPIMDGIVLLVGTSRQAGHLTLEITHRTDVLDAECAARIGGYHVTALTLMTSNPDGEHERQSLLSTEEVELQIDGLAGPHRELPDRRIHELFEARAAAHPDDVAAVLGDRRWTYQQLNTRANQIGGALLARGLAREGVVAVVTERNLDWLAAVLGVLKAGGVYLPIEPHFPAERIATTLTRAACGLVLTESGSAATLDEALGSVGGVQRLLVEEAYDEGHSGDNLGVTVAADQLAYIYFTSGSTGEPKGAMCEHAGMLNHLYAKIDDLQIGEGSSRGCCSR